MPDSHPHEFDADVEKDGPVIHQGRDADEDGAVVLLRLPQAPIDWVGRRPPTLVPERRQQDACAQPLSYARSRRVRRDQS